MNYFFICKVNKKYFNNEIYREKTRHYSETSSEIDVFLSNFATRLALWGDITQKRKTQDAKCKFVVIYREVLLMHRELSGLDTQKKA